MLCMAVQKDRFDKYSSTHQCRFLAFALDLAKANRVAADRPPLHISLLWSRTDELGERLLALGDPRKIATSFSAYNMYESRIGPLWFPKNAANNYDITIRDYITYISWVCTIYYLLPTLSTSWHFFNASPYFPRRLYALAASVWIHMHCISFKFSIAKTPSLVNFPHVSSASLIRFARSMYLAHLELIYRSAVSNPCASSSHL